MKTSSLDTPIKRTGTPASLSRPTWTSSMKLLLPTRHHHTVHTRDMLAALASPSKRISISTQLSPPLLLPLLLLLPLPLRPKGAVLQPGVSSPSPPSRRRPRRLCLPPPLLPPPGHLLTLVPVAEALRASTRWIRPQEGMAPGPRRRLWVEGIYTRPTVLCKGPCLRTPPACPRGSLRSRAE